MEDFFTRLLKEEKELNEKLKKLSLFIGTEKYFKLDFYDQELLIEQKIYMTGYSATPVSYTHLISYLLKTLN